MSENDYANHGKTIAVVFFSILFISIILLSSNPPVSKDALVHHLAVPKLYLQHGSIYEIPDMVFSYYPMNLDLLYLGSLYFGNDIIPKYIHFFFGLLAAWLIYAHLKRRVSSVYALGGALFFLSIPIIAKLSISAYVDLGLLCFTTASLLLLLKWGQTGGKPLPLILSAICCGLAMGTKYNGLVGFLVLSALVPFVSLRKQPQKGRASGIRPLGDALLFGLIALAVFSPWMIRNYIWAHNPIYPLYDSWFNAVVAERTRQVLGVFGTRAMHYHESWFQMALLPVRIFFQGQDGNPQYFDGQLNPFLLILPIAAFWGHQARKDTLKFEKNILLAFAVLFFAFSFFSTGLRIRYILPIVSPLVILSVYGFKKIVDRGKGAANRKTKHIILLTILFVLFCTFYLNAGYIYQQFKIVKPFEYLSGRIIRDDYITRYRPEYPAMQYLNHHASDNAKVLFFYIGNRGYYCNRGYTFDMINYKSTLHKIVKNSATPDNVYCVLKEKGITHFLIRNDIFNRSVKEDFSDKEKRILKDFFRKYVKRLYIKNGYGVFRLAAL